MDLLLGGRYQLVARLGRGGMGEVWRGVDTQQGRPVAVKTIRLAETSARRYDDAVKRFGREAQAVASLEHPNIVRAYDFGVDRAENMPYLVMELIEGESLANELESRADSGHGPFPIDRVLAIARDVCAGLGAAHRAGLVHRDLKPGNLMTVTGTGQVKIVDFGIARDAEWSRLTVTGGAVGTPAYMAPEQLVGGDIDGRTDLYALGCVLYELLTGKGPFTVRDAGQFLNAHLNVVPRPLRERRPDAPAELESLLRDLLAKKPQDRPPTVAAVAARLTRGTPAAPAPEPVAATVLDRPARREARIVPPRPVATPAVWADRKVYPLPPYNPRGTRRKVIAAAVAVIALVGGYVGYQQLSDGRDPDRHSIATMRGHEGQVRSVAFSPDGKLLASGSADGTVRLWDAARRTPVATLTGHTGWVTSVAFSPNGKLLASGGQDDTVRLWDVAGHTELATLTGHRGDVSAVAFSPDGRTLASGADDDTIRLWDVAGKRTVAVLTGHTDWVLALAYSPDGRTLASGSSDHTVRLWDVATHAPTETLGGNTNWVNSLAFSPDGQTLASGGSDQTIRFWNVGTIAHWNVGEHPPTATVRAPASPLSVAYSPDGKTLASGDNDHKIRLWNVAGRSVTATLGDDTDVVWSVAFSPDGKTIAGGGADRTIRLWAA